MNIQKKFAILMATCNGERFLEEQLLSLRHQTVDRIDVWVSDDGSTDRTLPIARKFAENWDKGRFQILLHGISLKERFKSGLLGATQNFLSLVLNESISADYYAFCDQDDVWDNDKLEIAYRWLAHQNMRTPCMYCSRTRIVDEDGRLLGLSPLFRRQPTFANAIIQNIAAGNTIVLNQAAMKLMRTYSGASDLVGHDWWCYLLISAFGGKVHYNADPNTSYRQHTNNLIGENASWRARMNRFKMIMSGRFKQWNEQNRNSLAHFESHLSAESRKILVEFDKIRKNRGLSAAIYLYKSNIHRQTIFGQLGLYFACVTGRL